MTRRGRVPARPTPRYAPSPGDDAGTSDSGTKIDVAAALRLVWFALIAFAAWAASVMWLTGDCAHHTYDYRSSTATCTLRRNDGGAACLTVPSHCWSAHSIRAVSPRWLSNAAAWGGPLWAWAPLMAWAVQVGGARTTPNPLKRELAALSLLACCASALVFVVASGMFRYAADHAWLLGHWDPSGHVFTYVFTALPLWFTAAAAAVQSHWALLPWWLRGWTAVLTAWLLFGTMTTSAFFHSRADVAIPLVLGVAALWSFQRFVAHLPLHSAWQRLSHWRMVAVWAAIGGLVVGVVTVAVVGKPWPLVAAYATFDAAVLSAVWWVVTHRNAMQPSSQPTPPGRVPSPV